jgi:hypothetical protein
MFEFCLEMHIYQFYEIKYISQTIHRVELNLYRKILDTLNYIMIKFHNNQDSVT